MNNDFVGSHYNHKIPFIVEMRNALFDGFHYIRAGFVDEFRQCTNIGFAKSSDLEMYSSTAESVFVMLLSFVKTY
jgi:hypothetical protein